SHAAQPGATRLPLRRLDAADVPGAAGAGVLLHAYAVDPRAARATQSALRDLRGRVAASRAVSVPDGCWRRHRGPADDDAVIQDSVPCQLSVVLERTIP